MITLEDISKKIGARTLFEKVNAAFYDGRRYGLTGPNGAGKSTLLKIMMGTEESSSGTCKLPKRVGFLKQNISELHGTNVRDVVIMGNTALWSAKTKMDALHAKESMTEQEGMLLANLYSTYEEEGGYSAESEAEILLKGVGIEDKFFDKTLSELPAGDQFKVMLCQALFGSPEALLLDEPTNHLDLESIGWLEEFLKAYTGIVIVVSHDRHFLNAITTDIADIDYDTITTYAGNYDAMVNAKAGSKERLEAEAKNRAKKVEQLQGFVSRFGAGTRASQVQSRIKEIDRINAEGDEIKRSNIQAPFIRFAKPDVASGRVVLSMKNCSFAYGSNQVIKNFSYELSRGDKVGVIGNNGSGKTTLLKLLAGELKADEGEFTPGHQVSLGYIPQEHKESLSLAKNLTAFEWLQSKKDGVYTEEVRGILGKMLFTDHEQFKKIGLLSGGETVRLLLGSLMLLKQNFFVLDEPTNHLDLASVGTLASALQAYEGTAVVASHDRDLIGRVANKIIAFEKGRIVCFPGGLEEYFASRKNKK